MIGAGLGAQRHHGPPPEPGQVPGHAGGFEAGRLEIQYKYTII